ncbi:ATPase, histidine kinase-, DNA gyrase B-, and HSP90-like domain protein [Synechococcus sp. PCC 7335]|uniref:histidine kinase n=1 Tax=Synechococcus sp. (strain ATCC 29403 / PCC 7335) TaxID=91464 RepID=UPI00017EE447|nr:histidine kinase [Synechococcus sp. PCC 7335]EDX85633.1 ATPase, histidine kinase-, DNA gyrase B-, and HSP90-like domain protein [Synechococcus sp. PCC 7335]
MEGRTPVLPKDSRPFKLLFFVDKRPNSAEQIRQIRAQVKALCAPDEVGLEIVDVNNQPYLAERFKLVATPALIKVSEDSYQILAGGDVATKLAHWWPRWNQELLDESSENDKVVSLLSLSGSDGVKVNAVDQSTEVIRLSDDIFRLEQEKETLLSQIEFKDRIIAMMAHDLRNPLTAASIALETLELAFEPNGAKADKFTPELIAHLLQSTKTQIRAVSSMITEILKAARGSDTNIEVSPQDLDLNDLCMTVIEFFAPKLSAKKQTIETDLPQDLPHVYADADQVQRVLSNLVDNAVKYTPVAGKIGIAALHRTTEKVQISIRDNGPGIPRENQKKIFEESFRLKRDRAEDGYGLGLALCQQVVRAHYGEIWVDSKQGEGSCFHFTLPVYRGTNGS